MHLVTAPSLILTVRTQLPQKGSSTLTGETHLVLIFSREEIVPLTVVGHPGSWGDKRLGLCGARLYTGCKLMCFWKTHGLSYKTMTAQIPNSTVQDKDLSLCLQCYRKRHRHLPVITVYLNLGPVTTAASHPMGIVFNS